MGIKAFFSRTFCFSREFMTEVKTLIVLIFLSFFCFIEMLHFYNVHSVLCDADWSSLADHIYIFVFQLTWSFFLLTPLFIQRNVMCMRISFTSAFFSSPFVFQLRLHIWIHTQHIVHAVWYSIHVYCFFPHFFQVISLNSTISTTVAHWN